MPKPCNLKTARTPKSESCSTPYELFTADYVEVRKDALRKAMMSGAPSVETGAKRPSGRSARAMATGVIGSQTNARDGPYG